MYRQVEYIESTGSQYIDTEFVPNSNTTVEMRVAFTDISATANLFCARGETTQRNTYTCFLITGSGIRFDYYNSVNGKTGYIPSVAEIMTIKADKNKIYINDVLKYTYSTVTFTAGGNMWLLTSYVRSGNSYDTMDNRAKVKLYSCKIYDGDTLVRDFVPSVDTESGKAGLYDNVNDKFYASKQDDFIYPISVKYLVRDGETIYTVSDGSLVEVSGGLSASLFQSSGADNIPDGALLITLSNPEVLCWTDAETLPTLTATVKGIPPQPQVIVSEEINLMDGSIKGIESVTIDCKGEPIFAVSFDKKATWLMHNGAEWVAVSDELSGMTKADFEAITTEQWQPKYEASSDMYIRCTILDETQSITTVNIDFIN
mgnify:FL=1